MKEICQYDDIWWRYEFAKSRGAIHSHAIIFSKKHHEMMKKCKLDPNPPMKLNKWLQTNELDDESSGIFSPEFVSMHPAGGEEISDENKNKRWIPDKTKLSPPGGTQDAPSKNPLSISLSEVFEKNAGLDAQHVSMVNRVA